MIIIYGVDLELDMVVSV